MNLDATINLYVSPIQIRLICVIGVFGRPMWKLMVPLQDVRVVALLFRASTTVTRRNVEFACKSWSAIPRKVATVLIEQRQGPEVPHHLAQMSGKEEEKSGPPEKSGLPKTNKFHSEFHQVRQDNRAQMSCDDATRRIYDFFENNLMDDDVPTKGRQVSRRKMGPTSLRFRRQLHRLRMHRQRRRPHNLHRQLPPREARRGQQTMNPTIPDW